MEKPDDIPEACWNGNHDYGQAGRCKRCSALRANETPDEKRTGGAGARTHPTTDREYREAMRQLERRSD